MANIFSPIMRLFNKGPISNPDKGYQQGGRESTKTKAGINVTDEQALRISAVWACIQLISNAVSGLSLDIFRNTEKGREKLKSRHYLTDIFHIRPNSWMKPRDLRACLTAQMALFNNAYAEILRSGERIVGLVPLRPGRMVPYIMEDGSLTYHYTTDAGVKVYAARSILHLKGFGFEGIVGAERNNYARDIYGLTAAAESFAGAQFANGGRPGGVLMLDKILTREQREQLRDLYEGISEGSINSNKLWILEAGMQYQGLDYSADQVQMITTRLHQVSEIARYYNMPEVMISAGNGKGAWPASFEQQMLFFLTHTIKPYLDEWEAAIKYSMLPTGTDIGVDHDPSSLVRMDSASISRYLSTLVQNGLMTREEGRDRLNLPKVDDPGASRLTVQSNLVNIIDLEGISDDRNNTQT